MNLKHWRHFLSIAEVRSLTGAAERLGVPQPVLSREMRDLEASLGNTLFVRHARGVALTPNGEIFRRRAEAILRDIARLPSEVAGGNHIEAGTLSLGMPPSMAGPLTGHNSVSSFRRCNCICARRPRSTFATACSAGNLISAFSQRR